MHALICWSPDSATIKEKMIYAATKIAVNLALKSHLTVDCEIAGTDESEVAYGCVAEKLDRVIERKKKC